MAKKKVGKDSEAFVPPKYVDKGYGRSAPAKDKFEELDSEDKNEAYAEEDMDEEGLNLNSEERSHNDPEEVEEIRQARQNAKEAAIKTAKKKVKK